MNSFDMAEHIMFMQNTLPQMFIAFVGEGVHRVKLGRNGVEEPKFLESHGKIQEIHGERQKVGTRIGQVIARERSKKAAKK